MTIDASNMKEVKLMPIVVRYFLPESGVKAKLLEFKSVPGETAEILSKYLFSVLDQTKLKDKLIGFCEDKCITNFGSIKRRAQNNVFYNVKRDLVSIGYTIHIVHNFLQHALDTLAVCVGSLLKIYKFFHIYTVQVLELIEMWNFANVEYQRLLQHVLEMFEALKSSFNSQEQCPTIIRQCFENPTQELNPWFVYKQLKYFNETMLKLERQKTSAVDVAIILTELRLNLHQNRVSNFVPHQAKRIWEKFEEDGEVDARIFFNETRCFYEKYKSYLNFYRDSYEGATPHLWLNSSENLYWTPVCASAEKINCVFAKQIMDIESLFDEHVLVKNHNSNSYRMEKWKNTPISYERKWTQLFQTFKIKLFPFQTFRNWSSLY